MTEKAGRRTVHPPTGTVTFLFTDIEGSTAMWENNPLQMEGALARHDEILRDTIEANGGYVFKTVGDAYCAAFASAREATLATLAAQRALFAEQWQDACRIRVRMALHSGAATERNGDYFGPPVNRVARLLSAGHGGQVLLSDVTYGLARDILVHLEPGTELRYLGEHRLRDLRYTERIFQLVVPDLPSGFPDLKTHGLVTSSNDVQPGGAASPKNGAATSDPPPPASTKPRSEPAGEPGDDAPAPSRPAGPPGGPPTRKPGPDGETVVPPPPSVTQPSRRDPGSEDALDRRKLINGRYELKQPIGGGGMAEVYLARDEVLERDVAMKVLRGQYADDEAFVKRFRSEARNAASLSHPNIVATHDQGRTEDDLYYIVMEHLQGGTLQDLIQSEGPLPPERAAAIAAQVARALAVAHEHGVVHRDIKPQNVLLTSKGDAKVADFGIARATTATRVTQEGSVMGTAQYISPEQALGRDATPKSDLYSLGIVLYEMLTGTLPFEADTPVALIMSHVNAPPRPPKEVNPQVPDELNDVTTRLLAKDPDDRYPDAATVADALEGKHDGGGDRSRVPVPDLSGQDLPEAGGTLTRAGLTLGDSRQVRNAAVREGAIADQDPRPGLEVEPGTTVRVAVSSGARRGMPRWALAVAAAGVLALVLLVGGGVLAWSLLGGEETVEVPPLEGQTLAAARETVGEDLEISSEGGREKGVIQSQDPEPGTEAQTGDSIEVVLGPDIAAVPDVTGRSQKEAEELLRSEGFEVEAVSREGSEEEAGKVLQQDPAGEAERGSTVEIAVGEAPPEEAPQETPRETPPPEEEQPPPEEDPQPAPGYFLARDDTGALTVEVPSEWGERISGAVSEEGNSWSAFAGTTITSSITAAPDLDAWTVGTPGTYMVASRELAQGYSDDELLNSGPNATMANECDPGAVEDFNRGRYSGKMQTWTNCGDTGATALTLSAAPEGRECVVVMQIGAVSEATQRLLDTFEVVCGGIAANQVRDGTELAGTSGGAPPG